ncbi:MAG: serine/threonine-protein kinase [Polyangiaceae bacterium]
MDRELAEWPFEPGDSVEGRYTIVRHLAKGGVGAVYEAQHSWTGLRVALKVLFKRQGDYAARMKAEARTLAQISHPNVVPVTDGDVTTELSRYPGLVWITMPLLEGNTLRELLLQAGALSVPRALQFGMQIADGCAAAHALQVVHRDLKPENVFVLADGENVKILDFGVSKIRSGLRPVELRTTDRFRLLGTQAYMAPELLQVGLSDARSDIYAVGHILYEMLTGRHCFSEGAGPLDFPPEMQLGLRQIFAPPAPVTDLAPQVPTEVNDIVMRALAKDPGMRQQSMQELSAALGHALPRLERSSPRQSPKATQRIDVAPEARRTPSYAGGGHGVPGTADSQVALDAAMICGAARFASSCPEITAVERGLRAMAGVGARDARFRGLLSDLVTAMLDADDAVRASYRANYAVAGGLREHAGRVLHMLRAAAMRSGWCQDEPNRFRKDRLDMVRGAALLIEPEHLSDAASTALGRFELLDEETRSFAFSVLVAFAHTPLSMHPAPRGALLALALGGEEDSELARAELARFVLDAAGTGDMDLGVDIERVDLSYPSENQDSDGARQHELAETDDEASRVPLAPGTQEPARSPPQFHIGVAYGIGLITALLVVALAYALGASRQGQRAAPAPGPTAPDSLAPTSNPAATLSSAPPP